MAKFMPAKTFVEVFGEYVPRLCIDTAVIGPDDWLEPKLSRDGFTPHFMFHASHGVALKARDEEPRLGQWGLPGGTIFKGETPEEASKRIIKKDLGIDVDVLGSIGYMHFPNEHREMDVDGVMTKFVIDSLSIVMLARAHRTELKSCKAKVGWFCGKPPVRHEYHTPFLEARGLLRT